MDITTERELQDVLTKPKRTPARLSNSGVTRHNVPPDRRLCIITEKDGVFRIGCLQGGVYKEGVSVDHTALKPAILDWLLSNELTDQ